MNNTVLLALAAIGGALFFMRKKSQGPDGVGARPSVQTSTGRKVVFDSNPATTQNPEAMPAGPLPPCNCVNPPCNCSGHDKSTRVGSGLDPALPPGRTKQSEPSYETPPFRPIRSNKTPVKLPPNMAGGAATLPGTLPGEAWPSRLGGGSSSGKAFMVGMIPEVK